MPAPSTQACPHREAVEALARETLPDERRRAVQRHLERCEPCRSAFRTLTADWLPRLRSYTVIERIGAGGFGEVFKVIHHAKQRTEALKLLHAETRFRTASFENEAHLIAQLHHPGIVTLYDAQLGTPPLYYTMELVEGQQLDDYFRSSDVALAERIEIFRQVALAMDYAHRQGVVHRDLKPQNILIDTAGQPHIVDFGIARMLAPAGDAGGPADRLPPQPEGSYGYVAPEEDAGKNADTRADIYALGALLCRSVACQPPSADERLEALSRTLRERQVSRASDLAAIIVRCLHGDPGQRYATCAEFSEDLANYVAARPVSAHGEPSLGYRAARAVGLAFLQHSRVILALLVVVLATSLAGLFRTVGACWSTAGFGDGATTIVEFGPSTIEAMRAGRIGADLPGLSPTNAKSWRLLHGELMRTLADAGPRVVVCDYYVPDCYPEYDEVLIRGFEALRAARVPVVVGSRTFDVNGKPVGCPEVLAAAHSYGALHGASPASKAGVFFVPICIRRGLGAPIPSLSVAGFAAARFPDSVLDLRPEDGRVLACYRRRHFKQHEPEWRTDVDEFPVALAQRNALSRLLRRDDEIIFAQVKEAATGSWAERTIPFEMVLTSSPAQLRTQFGGRVVLIGSTLPGDDEHTTADGRTIFGCHVQAQALDAFLARAHLVRISFVSLMLRTFLWCALASIIAQITPVATWVSPRRPVALCLALCALGFAIAVVCAWRISSPWMVEASIAGCTLLVAGSLGFLSRTIQARLRPIASGPRSLPAPAGESVSAESNSQGGRTAD